MRRSRALALCLALGLLCPLVAGAEEDGSVWDRDQVDPDRLV